MNSPLVTNTFPYFRAMNIIERLAYLRETEANLSRLENDSSLAQRRLEQWKSQPPFDDKDVFEKYLSNLGIDEEVFTLLLGWDQKIIQEHNEFDWERQLKEIFLQYDPTLSPLHMPEQVVQQNQTARAFDPFQPFLQYACSRFQKGVDRFLHAYPQPPFNPETLRDLLLANYPEQLLWTINRTLILELNIARLQGQLNGTTPQERFENFLKRMEQPEALLHFLRDYPVLTRLLATSVTQWVDTFLEFLGHLCQDWSAILELLGQNKHPDCLKMVEFGKGDRHQKGRAVAICTFTSGAKVVYKPRSLVIDAHFQDLLIWLNEQGFPWPFKTIRVLDCEDHGWEEFISPHPCKTYEEVHRYYKRQGAYLALLYGLRADDFHYENLTNEGEYPILLDLETLFTPLLIEEYDQPGNDLVNNSVLMTGLLPARVWNDANTEGVDVSGLGMRDGQITAHRVPFFEQINTDEMHIALSRVLFSGAISPIMEGQEIKLQDYTRDIVEGFKTLYRLLIDHRDALLSPAGPLAFFSDERTRFIVRTTNIYSTLLQEGAHPDLLQDGLDRDLFFDRLWVLIPYLGFLQKVIDQELADLWQMDIPIFFACPSSTDLTTSIGTKVKKIFYATGKELVEKKLRSLDQRDLNLQTWLIEASLASIDRFDNHTSKQVVVRTTKYSSKQPVDKTEMLQAAYKVNDRLQELAVVQSGNIGWFGLKPISPHYLNVSLLGYTLYAGISGIAFYLAYFGKVTGEKKSIQLARQVTDMLLSLMEKPEFKAIRSVGGFEGLGGIIYLLTHLSALWKDESLLNRAIEIVWSLPQYIQNDTEYDVINGSAGCIGALLALYSKAPDEQILTTAKICGNHLINNVTRTEKGIAWLQPGNSNIKQPLGGFSHGVAGIAWALLRLSQITGEAKFADTAIMSLEYERSTFSPEAGNWMDLRDRPEFDLNNDTPSFQSAWCHGAPGIGLGRLATLQWYDNPTVRAEIDAAIRNTLSQGFGIGHCLCHGDLGNVELLLQAKKSLSGKWQEDIQHISNKIMESINEYGWCCGNGLGIEEPSLMTGLAGIGYGLLRLASPDQIPALLLLDPPID